MSLKKPLLISALVAGSEATSVKFSVYTQAGCEGTPVDTSYEVATATGSACFDATTHSTKNQWCDEAGSKFHQEFYQGVTCAGTMQQQDYVLDTCANSVTGAADPTGYVKVTCTFTPVPAAPCFGRDTMVGLADGDIIPMSHVTAGDYVLPGPTRVVVNQHKNAAHLKSSLLKVDHAEGSISLTPDHVLNVDGSLVAARNAVVGSKLGNSEVSRVTSSVGGIINPLTTSGMIMADGVLATTYPEWIAGFAISYPTYLTAANLLSFLFPATTQAYYDAHLEHFFQSTVSSLKEVPAPLMAAALHLTDLLVSAGLVVYTLASLKAVLAITAVVAMAKTLK